MNHAIIDTTKGHDNHGQLTAHTNPDQCATVPRLTNTTPVGLTTALNGILSGQWAACPQCEAIDEATRRFVHES